MKKIGLMLAGLLVVITLTACSRNGNNAVRDYLDDNQEILVQMFDTFGLGTVELSATRDHELVATFTTTDAIYEQMEAVISFVGAADASGVIERYIVEQHTVHMRNLATVIASEMELDEVTIRIVVNLNSDELVNLTFSSSE